MITFNATVPIRGFCTDFETHGSRAPPATTSRQSMVVVWDAKMQKLFARLKQMKREYETASSSRRRIDFFVGAGDLRRALLGQTLKAPGDL